MLTVKFNGTSIPQIGLGTWPMQDDVCQQAVETALEVGYRHVDTAQMYGNEAAVGAGLAAGNVARSELFVTTKIWPDHHARDNLLRAADERLALLKVDYVDLLLLHWPSRDVPLSETIPALNETLSAGKARAIGISNFTARQIDEAVALSRAPLTLNQVEYHPYLNQQPVIEACGRHGLGMTAYCPTARGRVLDDPVIMNIASSHGKTPAQTALRWLIQQSVVVIPKSETPARIRENFEISDFELSDMEMQAITALHEPGGRIVDMENIRPEWDS